MKKLLLILMAASLTLTGYAAGMGDGSSKANAIEFDWVNGNTQEAGTFWYKVTFGNRLDIDAPNLALYLTNLSSGSAKVEIAAQYAGDEEKRNYTIVANSTKVWNTSATMIKNMVKDDEGLFVKLTSDQKVQFSAKVFEGTFADDACLKAEAYNENAHTLAKGTYWYTIDLKTLRDNKQGLKITYAASKGTSKIVSMISTDCPSTGLAGLKGSVPNGKNKVHEISAALIQEMSESTVYLKVENSKELNVTTEKTQLPETPIDFSNPTAYDITAAAPVAIGATTGVYRVALADLIPQEVTKGDGKKYLEPQITFNNESNTTATNVTVEIAFNSEELNDYKTVNVITKEETVTEGETLSMDFARNLLESLDAENCKYVYIRITATQDMFASARLKHMREGNACSAAQTVNWNETIYQNVEVDDESSTQWYAINIAGLKDETNPQDVTVTITNNGEATAQVTAEVAFVCPYIDLQTVTRSVEVGKPMSKTIKYSSIATLGSDMIYVGVTTTQAVTVKAVPAKAQLKPESEVTCDKAEEYKPVDFDLENGHKQAADAIVWYRVKAGDIKKAFSEDIPEIIITNEGDKKLVINGELSKNCPDIYENQTRTLTIGANGTYKKELAKDLFAKYDDADVFYIKLKGDQPFNFRLNKKIANEGASCAKAIPFNWTTGHNQDADVNLWYVIDLTEIQNTAKKKVHLTIKNLTGKDATIDGLFATECPATSPQAQSIALKGNQVREKDLARSNFLAFGEKVYIRLTGTQKFHFEARIEDADPFTQIDACSEADTEERTVKVKTDYNRVADAAWYRVKVSDLQDPELAPRVIVTNGAAAQNIKASIAYECPVTEEMQSITRHFAANQTLAKTIEQSMVNQIASKYEYVYVLVEGTKDYQFRIDMVDPNTGADCLHAVEIKKDVVRHHEAGATKWYKLNVADLIKNEADNKLVFSLTNTNGAAGNVHAAAFTDCEGEELIAGNATIGKNAKREKAITVEALMGLNTEWLYLQLTAAQAQDLLMTIIAREDLKPGPFTACDEAMPFAINTDYNQNAGDTVWYRVNIKAIRENTTGDATLTVTDLSGEENTTSAEIAWVCPVYKEMTGKTKVLAGNEVYTRIFGRDMLNSANGKDEAFIRVISEKKMKFRVDMHMSKGDECANPIEFDWANGNTNPQGTCLWYNVALTETKTVGEEEVQELVIPEGKDLELMIVNLSNEKAYASADLRFECKEPSLGDKQYTFAPKDTVRRVIDRDLIVNMGSPTSVLINLCTPNSAMFIKANFVDELKRDTLTKDTVVLWCDGEELVDGYTQPGFEATHTPKADDPSSLEWGDTLHVRVGTMLVDSVYHFKVVPMVAPAVLDQNTIPEDSKVVAKVGEKLDYSALNAYIVKYYTDLTTAYDSLADYAAIVWEAMNPETKEFDDIDNIAALQTELTADITNVVLQYTVGTVCGSEISDIITVIVDKGCESVTDISALDITWPTAFCGTTYDVDAVIAQVKAALPAGSTDKITVLYNGAEYNNEVMVEGNNVTFYAKVANDCSTSETAAKTMTVVTSTKENMIATLPLSDPYAADKIANRILLIDVNAINAGNYGLTLPEYYDTDEMVTWYRMVGTTPDLDNDELVQKGGYYLTTDNNNLENGTYYAVIVKDNAAAGECDGIWRTVVYSVANPASVSKRMINGKLYIITEDNVMYDAQGQKVQ